MALAVSVKSAIFVAFILEAVFIGFSRPDATPSSTEPSDSNFTVESCNQTCNPSQNRSCSDNECFCVLLNNSTEGHCYTWSWPGMNSSEMP
ncbi:evasin P1142-like [Dermacentor variabilis]|uniref:evasin P1142-like n=1 Tax=Dermacentor variabilis TaxID=34621 RepID=UPI003F5B1A64